jgi:hypothetical protein
LRDTPASPVHGLQYAQLKAAVPDNRATDIEAAPIIPDVDTPSGKFTKAPPPAPANDNPSLTEIPKGQVPPKAQPTPTPGLRPGAYARRYGGLDALGALLFGALNRASDLSEPYPGTIIPKSFSLSGFGDVKVSPDATRAMLDIVTKWPASNSLEPWQRTQLQGEIIDRFNIAANDAMRQTAGQINPYEIISTGGFDFMLAPGAKAGEPASIVMARATPIGNDPDVWPSLADRPADAIPRPPQTADAPYDQATYDKLYASSHDPAYAFSMARTMP